MTITTIEEKPPTTRTPGFSSFSRKRKTITRAKWEAAHPNRAITPETKKALHNRKKARELLGQRNLKTGVSFSSRINGNSLFKIVDLNTKQGQQIAVEDLVTRRNPGLVDFVPKVWGYVAANTPEEDAREKVAKVKGTARSNRPLGILGSVEKLIEKMDTSGYSPQGKRKAEEIIGRLSLASIFTKVPVKEGSYPEYATAGGSETAEVMVLDITRGYLKPIFKAANNQGYTVIGSSANLTRHGDEVGEREIISIPAIMDYAKETGLSTLYLPRRKSDLVFDENGKRYPFTASSNAICKNFPSFQSTDVVDIRPDENGNPKMTLTRTGLFGPTGISAITGIKISDIEYTNKPSNYPSPKFGPERANILRDLYNKYYPNDGGFPDEDNADRIADAVTRFVMLWNFDISPEKTRRAVIGKTRCE